ncbi:MAG: hypothetical protein GVY13_15425 [Alphaproteobacteria bacterium]|jgi:hypothetical protein|nr:hypothetical protein [Alphaproteobacteria bacterium]
MARQDISYLEKLPKERVVLGVTVHGVQNSPFGVLVKLLMANNTTELINLCSGPAKATYEALKIMRNNGRLPPSSAEQNETLQANAPEIYEYDCNQHFSDARMAAFTKFLQAKNGCAIEYVMQDASRRAFAFPTEVARFFGEYIGQYKECFEFHVDEDPSEPIAY